VLRYAITSRPLFPSEAEQSWVPPVPLLGQGFPSTANRDRVPSPSRFHREERGTQLSTLLRQTAQWATQGIDYIQLREKDLPPATLADLARRILETIGNASTKLLINSRPDVAIAARAHGVHLTSAPGQLTPVQIRHLYSAAHLPPPTISISCHTLAEIEQVRRDADLILFSPIFHKSIAGELVTPGQGLEVLHAACLAAAPTPVYALGGVTPENAAACLEAGAAGIAGIRLFLNL
jgi:thiamine-phosphate pyrophosphorylase